MLYTSPTYALCAEASFTSYSTKGENGVFVASEPLLCAIGGGSVSGSNSGDYSELYGLLRALCASVGSRLFRIYHIPNNINPKNKAK